MLDELGFELGELLGGRLTGCLHLGQRGFGGRNTGFGGLGGGFGRRERGNQFSQALLGSGEAIGQLGRIAGDLGDLTAGLALEEADLAEPVAGDEGLGVVETDDLGDLVGLLDALRVLQALTIDGPHGRGAVGTARQETTVGQEGDGLDVAAVGGPGSDLLAGLHLPRGDGAVGGAAGQDVGVGAPGEVGDAALVLAERVEFAAVVGFPDEDVAVAVGGREQDAVGAEVRAGDPLGVLGDDVELLARGDIVALHLLRVGAERDLTMVGRDVGRHQLVELLADLGDALAGLDVPDDGVAELAAAAAAHDQERAVGAELQRTRITFGVRQDAGELMAVGIVEQDLLLAGDGEERGPRTGRHRGHRGGAGRHDDRLEQDVLRTGHGTLRLARTAGEGKVDLGLIGGLGHAALGLEQAAGDPLGKERQVLGVEGRAFRRHEGFFLLGAARPETAAGRIAGVDDRAAAAAVHQAGVAGQFEAALLLVRVMAREALVLEQRTDVVVVGQLLRVLRGRGGGDEPGGQDEAAAGEPTERRRGGGHTDGGNQWLK